MPTWVYNSGNLGGIQSLQAWNGGMGGLLAANGNAVEATPEQPTVKRVTYSPPGGSFSGSYVTGMERRIVRWRWAICAASAASLYEIEAVIAKYIDSGKAFTLSDGYRDTVHAVLDSARPLSRYDAVTGGRWRRVWMLEFHVLAPGIGGTKL